MRTMKRMKRVSLVREEVEARLKKNERRIQAIAEESYKLRQALEQIDALKPQEPYVKPKDGEKEPVIAPDPPVLQQIDPGELPGTPPEATI